MVVDNILYLLFKICCVWCCLFLKTICFTCGSLKLKWNARFGAFEKQARQLPCCTRTPRSKSKQKNNLAQTTLHPNCFPHRCKKYKKYPYLHIYLYIFVGSCFVYGFLLWGLKLQLCFCEQLQTQRTTSQANLKNGENLKNQIFTIFHGHWSGHTFSATNHHSTHDPDDLAQTDL